MNLLLVDDEAFALEALEHAINWKSLGIDQVFTCGNIKAARQICQESDIQIMICDIEMPNGTARSLPPSHRNVCSLRSTSGCSWSAVPIRTAMPTIFSGMPPETASFLIRMLTMFPVCFTSARFRLKIRILACSLTV